MSGCRGICHLYKGVNRYVFGNRYCSTCDFFIRAEHIIQNTCPCCHYKLRIKSRLYSRERYLKRKCRGLESEKKTMPEKDQKRENQDPSFPPNSRHGRLNHVPSVDMVQSASSRRGSKSSIYVNSTTNVTKDGQRNSL